MYLNLLNKVGEWNPQLLRELKGRLKVFNVIFAFAISLIGQLGLLLYHLGGYPTANYRMYEDYCNLGKLYRQQLTSVSQQIQQAHNKINFYNSKTNYDLTQVRKFKEKLQVLQEQQRQLDTDLYRQSCPIP